MRKLALTLTAALVVGGCTSETGGVQDAVQIAAKSPALPSSPLSTEAKRITSFASMPDRGALLSFERLEQPVRRKAYTYHAVNLSEAHALRAAHPGGAIEVPTPSGKTMRIAYERHEESLDGNWTWIGRTADGLEAIITFGEKAVFGRIAQPGAEALRLTMSAGRAWLVEVDPSKVLDGNMLGDANDTGMLLPPKTLQAAVATKRAKSLASGDTKAGPADTIDLVIGYTSGFSAENNGDPLTRISFLVAVANQAYQASQITGRLRLVHTLQVSYTDGNSNEVALQALTGQTCNPTCSATPVPTELVPLRNARDQYGGDLVSLVRGFQAPQHQSCGIAWLLGGGPANTGGTTIDNTDAPFGYSVVSDGNDDDETDGRNYFCTETTLAHELGHNMGQQHNIEDSGGDSGTHPYSYGYREASTTGFYTIMAYRLSNSTQAGILNFGNPNVTSSGRPTGTATADNARSMNLSMPLVAQFRSTVVPFAGRFRNDLNGNGTSDLFWFNITTNQFAYWLMNNTATVSTGLYSVGANFRVAATGDLDGDGRADVIWRDSTTNYHYLWRSRGDGTFDTPFLAAIGPGWTIARTTDLNGDGRDDLVWENTGTGQMAYWLMNGTTVLGTRVYSVGTAFRIVGAGDLDGDGRGDILWANPSQGFLYLWRSRADGGFDTPFVAAYGTTWNIAAVLDVNGDGRADLVWEEPTQGLMATWFMNGATVSSTNLKSVGTAYRIATTGDLNADGRGDLVWANSSTGLLFLWRSLGTGEFETPFLASYSTAWSLIP